jgi:hypothetical protein
MNGDPSTLSRDRVAKLKHDRFDSANDFACAPAAAGDYSHLVSWFRSSQIIDIGLKANFETKTTLGFK